jgi:hypothetical protein
VDVPFSPTLAILSSLLFLTNNIYRSHDQQEEDDPSSDLQYQHQPSQGGFTSALPNAIHMRQWWKPPPIIIIIVFFLKKNKKFN